MGLLQGERQVKDIVTQLRTNSECLAPSIMLEAADEIERLREECDRLARRNTMLIKELEERGRKFTPEQLQRAIVKAMYETEG